MGGHQDGDADTKFWVFCFMSAPHHTCIAAEAAADGGDGQKCGLRNAPEIILCLVFIHKHKHKGERIYYYQVEHDNIHKKIPFRR